MNHALISVGAGLILAGIMMIALDHNGPPRVVASADDPKAYGYMVCLKKKSREYGYPQSAPIGWPDYKNEKPDCDEYNIMLEDVTNSEAVKRRPFVPELAL